MNGLGRNVNLPIRLNGIPIELIDHLSTTPAGQTWWARPLIGSDRTEREVLIGWDDVCRRIEAG